MVSSNDLIRSRQHVRWERNADLLGGFQIDDELKLRRLLDRQVGGLGTLQNFVNVVRNASVAGHHVRSVVHQSTGLDRFFAAVHHRQSALYRKANDPFMETSKYDAPKQVECIGALLIECGDYFLQIVCASYFPRLNSQTQRTSGRWDIIFHCEYIGWIGRIVENRDIGNFWNGF